MLEGVNAAYPPAFIDQLRLLPDDERVALLVARREDQWFDRSSARVQARALADVMMAFGNAEGGLVVIGIHDGHVEGIARAGGRENQWRQAARDFAVPPLPIRFELVPCINDVGDQDQLLLVEVEASEHVHESVKGDVILRIGDENRRLSSLEVQELRYDKGGTFFDGTPVSGAELADLDDERIAAYLKPLRSIGRAEEALASRGLTRPGKRRSVPTVAGVLTLSRDPQRWFPEARVRLLRYEGRSIETGARANVVADVWVDGPLREQVLGARRHLRRWLGTAVRANVSRSSTSSVRHARARLRSDGGRTG